MSQTKSSFFKIQNKGFFYIFMVLYLVYISLKMFNITSLEVASVYSNMFYGFCIGALTVFGITQPKMVKRNLKQVMPFIAIVFLLAIAEYFITKSKYGV